MMRDHTKRRYLSSHDNVFDVLEYIAPEKYLYHPKAKIQANFMNITYSGVSKREE